ncbi:hypothetical protein F7734_14650 [Scytonema sp. UIC 10036]|uniref:hypothetical protein n=1 Tax=Scytonema sp. UIC 10036 TaxID=2304196 RepID=UPI0012DA4B2C|nr:hypothetical protein [Scytonema sp. UIC 10036]MUG93596.1 hypothetical protein [Scytonema sp. UIC 10036]
MPVIILMSCLGVILAMAMGTPYNNPFLTQDGFLTGALEFQDGQMGFAGFSGVVWTISPDGSCQAARFLNETVSPPHQTGQLDRQNLVQLANVLSSQNFSDLPSEIPSEPTLNPHRFTIRWGTKSSTLTLKPRQSLEDALRQMRNQPETPQSRFFTIAQFINQLLREHCGND